MSLEGNSQLNGIGEDAQGWSFVRIAVDTNAIQLRQFDVAAIAKDGREILREGAGSRGAFGTGLREHILSLAIPLADVAKFRIGTRPIRTMEWKDVVLPGSND
jgi:hypothetical protein